MPRFYAPQSGEIRIDDIPINDLQLSDLRGLISYVGQNVVLFNDTVRNNITYGVDPDQQHDLELALRSAHVDEFVDRLPQGLETIIGEGGVQLSGGQRQRLALARALYKRAPILILDEATSSLDSESERYVQGRLGQDHGGFHHPDHRASTVDGGTGRPDRRPGSGRGCRAGHA